MFIFTSKGVHQQFRVFRLLKKITFLWIRSNRCRKLSGCRWGWWVYLDR